MSLLFNERERRAAEELARRNGPMNFMSVGIQVEVLNLVKREKLEEEAAAERKMAEIAALDAANAAKRKLMELAVQVPAVETDAYVKNDIATDDDNKKRQKANPRGYRHPLLKEVRQERRLEREFNPQPRRAARKDWREKLTSGPHWQDALEWFRMTPAEKAVAEAEIEIAVNTVIGVEAQTLAAQAGWDAIDPKILAQMDKDGWPW